MTRLSIPRPRPLWPLVLGAGLVLWGIRQPLPPPDPSRMGLRALADTLFTLALWGYLLLLGAALGIYVLQKAGISWATPAERLLWALPTGLILLGYPVYGLGLLGWLHPNAIGAMLLGLTIWRRHDLHQAAHEIRQGARAVGAHLIRAPRLEQGVWAIILGLCGGSLLLALTPPTQYDALWYHLQAPRLFLEAGRVYPEFNNLPANYAFAASMVYAIPMAFGNDVAPQLIHWTFGMILLGLAYRLAYPRAGRMAWIAPAFVLTMVDFSVELARAAMADAATGCLELMAFGALMQAAEQQDRRRLIAAGGWMGLAIATKASALPALAAGATFWFHSGFPNRLTQRARTLADFLIPALALAIPWYLKNLIWFHHPLIPQSDSSGQVGLMANFLSNYINSPSDITSRIKFIYHFLVDPPLALPLGGMLIPLLFSGPLPWEAIALGTWRLVWWIAGPPGIRYLLSAFALWGIGLAEAVSVGWTRRLPWRLAVLPAIIGLLGYFIPVLIFMGAMLLSLQPWKVITGAESRADYLRMALDSYRGMEFMRDHLSPHDRVLMIGDPRHYYCPPQCYPEADHFTWTRLVLISDFDMEKIIQQLKSMEVTHLWLHKWSIQWLLDHDPGGYMRRSDDFLRNQFLPRCAQTVYADKEVEIVRLTCLR